MKEVRIDLLQMLDQMSNTREGLTAVVGRWLKQLSINPLTMLYNVRLYNGTKSTLVRLEDIVLIDTPEELVLQFSIDVEEELGKVFLIGRYFTSTSSGKPSLTDIFGISVSMPIEIQSKDGIEQTQQLFTKWMSKD